MTSLWKAKQCIYCSFSSLQLKSETSSTRSLIIVQMTIEDYYCSFNQFIIYSSEDSVTSTNIYWELLLKRITTSISCITSIVQFHVAIKIALHRESFATDIATTASLTFSDVFLQYSLICINPLTIRARQSPCIQRFVIHIRSFQHDRDGNVWVSLISFQVQALEKVTPKTCKYTRKLS